MYTSTYAEDVTVSGVDSPVVVNIPKLKDVKPPVIQVNNYDYTKIFTALQASVDKLTEAVESRPERWKAVRNSKGFIDYIDGVEKDEDE